ncbi:MAG: ABC transporter permease, partial [Lachnospiraceae bacterium]|nr:ABC transporter permease [Lachnospiraceae bacterium]
MEIPTPKKNPFSAQMDLSKFEKASEEEKKQQDVMAQSSTFFRDGMKKLLRNPLAVLSLLILVFVIVLMIITPRMVPYSYSQIITVGGQRDKAAANLKPFEYSEKEQAYMQETGEKLFPHILGTDELCRDYFIRVVYGTRVSFLVGFFASLMVLAIGTLYGSISGYAGGRTDLIMMRIVDIIYSLPDLLIIILLSVVFRETGNFSKIPLIGGLGTNMVSMFIVFALLYWVGMARLVRGQILQIK